MTEKDLLGKCEICGEKAILYYVDTQVGRCKKHKKRVVNHELGRTV